MSYLSAVVALVIAVGAQQSTKVVLPQGILTGIRLQTERRVVVTAYLGIPYALPPVGPFRFSAPERHPGWNQSLVAEHFRPDCPQPREDSNSQTMSEDCLYLNVFVPETGTHNDFPVAIFIEGEDFVTGTPRAVAAQELAAEGVIIVTLSYRLNVFGFICLEDVNSRGNLGLLDQYLAILWVRENVLHFGGRSDITLIGHGAGASAVVTHLTSPRTRGLFNRAIIMSGSVFSPILRADMVVQTSRTIAKSLGCLHENGYASNSEILLKCLRQKSADEVLAAYNNAYKTANWTSLLVPIADGFLPERMQYLPQPPTDVLKSGKFRAVPVMTGTTASEGTVLIDRWNDLASETEGGLGQFMKKTAIPKIMSARDLHGAETSSFIEWKYMENTPPPRLSQLIQLYTDTAYTAPHWSQVDYLMAGSEPVYVYRFSHNEADGFGPGGHGAELPFLFGPRRRSKWQQSNQVTFGEERLSLRIKRLWTTFMRTGNPNPSNENGSMLWPAYAADTETYLDLFSDPINGRTMDLKRARVERSPATFWNTLLPSVSNATQKAYSASEPERDIYMLKPGECGPYKNAMFTTLFFLILLIACLILALILLKRRAAGRQRTIL